MRRALRRSGEIFVHSWVERTLHSEYFRLPPERFKVRLWGIGKPNFSPAQPLHPQPYYCALGSNGRTETLIKASRLLPEIPVGDGRIGREPAGIESARPRASPQRHSLRGGDERAVLLGVHCSTSEELSTPCGHVTLVPAIRLRKAVIRTGSGHIGLCSPQKRQILSSWIARGSGARGRRELWNDPKTTARLAASNQAFSEHCHEDVTRAELTDLLMRYHLSPYTNKAAPVKAESPGARSQHSEWPPEQTRRRASSE